MAQLQWGLSDSYEGCCFEYREPEISAPSSPRWHFPVEAYHVEVTQCNIDESGTDHANQQPEKFKIKPTNLRPTSITLQVINSYD